MNTTDKIFALYFGRTRDADAWQCLDQELLTEAQVEAMMTSNDALRARVCRLLGFCQGEVFVKVVDCSGDWWNHAEHGRVDRRFFRGELVQVCDTRTLRFFDPTPPPPPKQIGDPRPGSATAQT